MSARNALTVAHLDKSMAALILPLNTHTLRAAQSTRTDKTQRKTYAVLRRHIVACRSSNKKNGDEEEDEKDFHITISANVWITETSPTGGGAFHSV